MAWVYFAKNLFYFRNYEINDKSSFSLMSYALCMHCCQPSWFVTLRCVPLVFTADQRVSDPFTPDTSWRRYHHQWQRKPTQFEHSYFAG